jgi:hypothetical protein
MKTSCKLPLLFAIALLLISGCASQGAKRLPADQFDYNAAISSSVREQMLLNIVRSRYQEMPVFLDVSSVVAQYSYQRSAGVGWFREFINNSIAPQSDSVSVDANVAFSELPTISYTPLTGEKFSKHLYSQVPAWIFFGSAHKGYATDLLMQIGLQRIGTAENMSFSTVRHQRARESDLKQLVSFARVIELLFVLSHEGVLEVQVDPGDEKTGKKPAHYLVFSDHIPEHLRSVAAEVRQLIGVKHHNRFQITERTAELKDDEVAIQARSVMAMIEFMSRGVEIPDEHLKAGWVIDYGLLPGDGDLVERTFPFIMRSSKNHPGNVFAAVRYQDYWFYIAHNDITSKRSLEHLMVLFQIKAPSTETSAPLLTLPTR